MAMKESKDESLHPRGEDGGGASASSGSAHAQPSGLTMVCSPIVPLSFQEHLHLASLQRKSRKKRGGKEQEGGSRRINGTVVNIPKQISDSSCRMNGLSSLYLKTGDRAARNISLLCSRVITELKNGPQTRDELAEITGFARQRVCTVLSVYKAVGLVRHLPPPRTSGIEWDDEQSKILPNIKEYTHKVLEIRCRTKQLRQRERELIWKLMAHYRKCHPELGVEANEDRPRIHLKAPMGVAPDGNLFSASVHVPPNRDKIPTFPAQLSRGGSSSTVGAPISGFRPIFGVPPVTVAVDGIIPNGGMPSMMDAFVQAGQLAVFPHLSPGALPPRNSCIQSVSPISPAQNT